MILAGLLVAFDVVFLCLERQMCSGFGVVSCSDLEMSD